MYSEDVERAIRTALHAHDGQTRKGSSDPYVVHPIHIALLLTRHGAEDHVVQAGLLHDVVEDCADWDLRRLEDEFGSEVAAIVAELTEDKSLSWEARKRHGVDQVARMSPEAAMVKAADKLHNLTSMVAALTRADDVDAFWARFNGGRERTLQMARELVEALAARVDEHLANALRATVEMLEAVDRERRI